MSEPTPIPLSTVEKVLEQLDSVAAKAIDAARAHDIDAQQVAIERLADVATKLRAARDLLEYSREAGPLYQEQAAVFAGRVAAQVARLVRDHGPEHGLDAPDLAAESIQPFVRDALREDRVRAIGRRVAEHRGRNDCPLEEVYELTRDAVREFAEATATTSSCPRSSSRR
jgi:hypothetical protein